MPPPSYGAVANDDSSRDDLDDEIADHYLSSLKYGLEGTDGTMLSNYKAYMANHHPFLGIFYTSPKNPYHGLNKALTFWNSSALMFFYSCLFPKAMSSFPTALLITLLMLPYSNLLHMLATCNFARGRSCFVSWSRKCGSFLLFLLAILAVGFLAAGIIVLKLESRPIGKTILVFTVSMTFSLLLPFILGLSNWYLSSWKGVLCCPQFSCKIGSFHCDNEEYRCCPLLELCPVNFVLNMYCLGESTFLEDKKKFEELYPGRIAVDNFGPSDIKAYESGLLLQSSDSCPFNLDESHIETV